MCNFLEIDSSYVFFICLKMSTKQHKTKCSKRYHPFPRVPSLEEYKHEKKKWDKFANSLKDLKKSQNVDTLEQMIEKEEKEIELQEDKFVENAKNYGNWNFQKQSDLQCIIDEKCLRRSSPYPTNMKCGYLLNGTNEAFLCDLCYTNFQKSIEEDTFQLAVREEAPTHCDRAQDTKNWIEMPFESDSDYVSIEDILCDNTDICWYQGNTDRLNGYKESYRLKGTDIYMCDVCMSNSDGRLSNLMISKIEDA